MKNKGTERQLEKRIGRHKKCKESEQQRLSDITTCKIKDGQKQIFVVPIYSEYIWILVLILKGYTQEWLSEEQTGLQSSWGPVKQLQFTPR